MWCSTSSFGILLILSMLIEEWSSEKRIKIFVNFNLFELKKMTFCIFNLYIFLRVNTMVTKILDHKSDQEKKRRLFTEQDHDQQWPHSDHITTTWWPQWPQWPQWPHGDVTTMVTTMVKGFSEKKPWKKSSSNI